MNQSLLTKIALGNDDLSGCEATRASEIPITRNKVRIPVPAPYLTAMNLLLLRRRRRVLSLVRNFFGGVECREQLDKQTDF